MQNRQKATAAGLWIVSSLIGLSIAFSAPQTYTEDFSTLTYKDSVNTTADWDTSAGELRLRPFKPSLIGDFDTPGAARSVAIAGDLAFVADEESGLFVIDVTDPSIPLLVGSYDTPGTAWDVAVAGDHAFVADGSSGLLIIDISDPVTPTLAGMYDTPDRAFGVAVDGNLAFVADADSGLQVIDITDPTMPVLAGWYNTSGVASKVTTSGDWAFVADEGSGLQIIDISDPTTPVLAGNYNTQSLAKDVAVSGDYVLIADGFAGLQVIDILDPTNPMLVGSIDTPGFAFGVAVSGDLVIVADEGSGLQVIDIANPVSPEIAFAYDTSGAARGVVMAGEVAFVADGGPGLQVIDIRHPMSPALVLSNGTPNIGSSAAMAGNLGFVTGQYFGLRIVDIRAKTLVGSYDTPGLAHGVAVAGDCAFVADYSAGLQVIDISDPSTPTLAGSYDTPGLARDVAVSGNFAFVADSDSGLQVIDITDTSNPLFAGSYNTPGGLFWAVAVSGDLAFVASQGAGLLVVDIMDPFNPVLVGSFDAQGTGKSDVAVAGDLAFVTDDSAGLQVVDISDPTSPVLVGQLVYTPPDRLDGVAVEGDFAFLSGNVGLVVVDISDPTTPTFSGSYGPEAGKYRDVAVSGEFALVAVENSGWRLIQVHQHDVEDPANNVGQSLTVNDAPDFIVRVRLATQETAGVSWEVATFHDSWEAAAVGSWVKLASIGVQLRWRTTHGWSPGQNPTVSSLTIDWRNQFGPINSISDVPDDQGGRVYVQVTRSGYDFAIESSLPVTQYGVYRRVDSIPAARSESIGSTDSKGLMAAEDPVSLPGAVSTWVNGTQYVQASAVSAAATFPPGTWAHVATVPATQADTYLVEVPTAADSSTSGTNYSVFVVTTHTTTPSVWFISVPDSGYSVDNIAPGMPQNISASYQATVVILDWDDAPEEDFQFYRIYRDTEPTFLPSVSNLLVETAASDYADVTATPWSFFYKVASVDHGGNESYAGAPDVVTDAEPRRMPMRFALHDAVPNPFNPLTTLSFSLPSGGHVQLVIYDVAGRLVRSLLNETRPPGRHDVAWEGLDNRGNPVSSGVYLYRLEVLGFVETKRMVLMK